LKEISIFINSKSHVGNINESIIKQFLANCNFDSSNEINFDKIKHLLIQINKSSTEILNIFGGDIFNYSKSELLKRKLNQDEIFKNKLINQNEFGKLIIMVNGDAYTNLNNKPLGNINNTMLFELVYKELNEKNSWIKPRNSVNPCNKCVFSYLCPPISNYGYILKRHNFCNISQ
jgi:hypothetical protein